jgi:predicted dehydrogenase
MTLAIGVTGTGADPDDPGQDGYAMAYRHASGYERLDDCELLACADIVPENATAFAERFDVPHVYEEFETMLTEHDLDVLSVCVPPGVHADVVCGAAETDVPAAIHCEKPIATTWGDCKQMATTCRRHDVALTINHQLRFGAPVRNAKTLLDAGRIGDPERIELAAAHLYDTGTHLFDVCGYLTDQEPIEWVIGQVEYTDENVWFGAYNATQGLAQWRYEDGVDGLAATGDSASLVRAKLRVVGSDGVLELGPEDGPPLRVRDSGTTGWQTVETNGEGIYGPRRSRLTGALQTVARFLPGLDERRVLTASQTDRAIADVVRAVREDGRSELHVENALQTTELIFAAWESARRRGRVELPLAIEDNPLAALIEAGLLSAGGREPSTPQSASSAMR